VSNSGVPISKVALAGPASIVFSSLPTTRPVVRVTVLPAPSDSVFEPVAAARRRGERRARAERMRASAPASTRPAGFASSKLPADSSIASAAVESVSGVVPAHTSRSPATPSKKGSVGAVLVDVRFPRNCTRLGRPAVPANPPPLCATAEGVIDTAPVT
jgi:hypothetical protein